MIDKINKNSSKIDKNIEFINRAQDYHINYDPDYELAKDVDGKTSAQQKTQEISTQQRLNAIN